MQIASYEASRLQGPSKRCKSLKYISFYEILHNTTLMNINSEILHYQLTLIFLCDFIIKINA